MQQQSPDMKEALRHLPRLLEVLTNLSLQSTATLLRDYEAADQMLADYYKELENLSAVIRIQDDHLNPKWNKTYGKGGVHWDGALDDGRKRGDVPYFCPHGWMRFSLKVCEDADFDRDFGDWGYLYHGTNSKHIGPILMSGLRASKGLCFCGPDDHAVYMSPSIEYCGHPRYGCIDYNPETRKWMQCVLQCRVKPSAVWQKKRETLCCEEFGLTCDPNVSNDQLEWLFKPAHYDSVVGSYFIKDVIICTGIMMRITDVRPTDLEYWWSKDPRYLERWNLDYPIIDPRKPPEGDRNWIPMDSTEMFEFSLQGSFMGESFNVVPAKSQLGESKLSPCPFGKGGMRFAYYLQTQSGMYVVKSYNQECLKHITEGLRIRQEEAVLKEVNTYLVAAQFAESFNQALPSKWRSSTNMINFLQPYVFKLRGADGKVSIMFGERYVEGKFIKWNNNAGFVNTNAEAKEMIMDEVMQLFCHYTWDSSKGRLMVVDIQGWNLGIKGEHRKIVFTDPQIHTSSFTGSRSRHGDPLYQRFSLGNLGKTGMTKFFRAHTCSGFCKELGLQPVGLGPTGNTRSGQQRHCSILQPVGLRPLADQPAEAPTCKPMCCIS